MKQPLRYQPNPELDLILERVIDVPPERVWHAWTRPEQLKKWFTPKPWKTVHCEIDLRPGGLFRTVMRSPEGNEYPGDGCYLEVIENERLVWTNALQAGYRPAAPSVADPGHEPSELRFTAILLLEPNGKGTKYTAIAMHPDAAAAKRHAGMGFHDGWGKALDQLVEMVKPV
jgi:uncharacterized protein YndB with AHSA1/START domain